MQQSATPMKATCPRQEEKPVHASRIPATVNAHLLLCIIFYSLSQCQHDIYNSVFPPCAHHSREKAICIGCGLSVHSGPLSSLVALTMIAAATCVIHVRASCLHGYTAHIGPKHTRTLSAYVNITCMKPGTFSHIPLLL